MGLNEDGGGRSLLTTVCWLGKRAHVHLLLQANADVNRLYCGASLFLCIVNWSRCFPYDYENISLMLLFAGGNPREKVFKEEAKPQVRKWLQSFLKAKELFT